MVANDVASIQQIERDNFSTTWQEGAFLNELKNPCAVYRVMCDPQDLVIGYAGYWLIEDEAHITSIAIDQSRRGAGLGKRLLLDLIDTACAAKARWVTLEVRADNTVAQQMYRRFGFARVGIRKKYYQNEFDGWVMWAGNLQSQLYQDRLDAIRQSLA